MPAIHHHRSSYWSLDCKSQQIPILKLGCQKTWTFICSLLLTFPSQSPHWAEASCHVVSSPGERHTWQETNVFDQQQPGSKFHASVMWLNREVICPNPEVSRMNQFRSRFFPCEPLNDWCLNSLTLTAVLWKTGFSQILDHQNLWVTGQLVVECTKYWHNSHNKYEKLPKNMLYQTFRQFTLMKLHKTQMTYFLMYTWTAREKMNTQR